MTTSDADWYLWTQRRTAAPVLQPIPFRNCAFRKRLSKIDEYIALMHARAAKSRPKQGARLAALRKAAGLSQTELAHAIGVPQQTVAYWETCATAPRSDVLPKMAKALGVRVEDILHDAPPNAVRKPGPVGKLQRVLELASKLPRRDQELIEKFVHTLMQQHKKAG